MRSHTGDLCVLTLLPSLHVGRAQASFVSLVFLFVGILVPIPAALDDLLDEVICGVTINTSKLVSNPSIYSC